MYTEKQKENIKKFLLDIECLNALSPWINQRSNIFEILKLEKYEIRHSNFLAWLFNANESHGLGDKIIRSFMNRYVELYPSSDEKDFRLLTTRFDTCISKREDNDIDIQVLSEKDQIIIVIENKIKAKESKHQLAKYEQQVSQLYPDYEKYFIYLTPEGEPSSNPELWKSMDYYTVRDVILDALTTSVIPEKQRMYIQDYVDNIRYNILKENEDLSSICSEIYNRHGEALDLLRLARNNSDPFDMTVDKIYKQYREELAIIYRNIPDRIDLIIREWLQKKEETGLIQVDWDKSISRPRKRFITPLLDNLIPIQPEQSLWKNGRWAYYEIQYDNNSIKLCLTFCASEIPDSLNKVYDALGVKHTKRYNTYKRFGNVLIVNETITDKDITSYLNRCLNKLFDFESNLLSKL